MIGGWVAVLLSVVAILGMVLAVYWPMLAQSHVGRKQPARQTPQDIPPEDCIYSGQAERCDGSCTEQEKAA